MRIFSLQKLLPRKKEIFNRNDIFIGMNKFIRDIFRIITPPPAFATTAKAKSSYLLWVSFYQTLPKTHRYSLGQKIDTLFVEIIEAISLATFLSEKKNNHGLGSPSEK